MKKRIVSSMLVALLLVVATLFSACSSVLEYGVGDAKAYLSVDKSVYSGLELNIVGLDDIKDEDVEKEIFKRLYAHKEKEKDQVAADVFKTAIQKYDDIGIFYNVTLDNETVKFDGANLIKLYPSYSSSTKKLTDATALTLKLGSGEDSFWKLVEDKFVGRKPGELNGEETEILGTLTKKESKAAVAMGDIVYLEYSSTYVQNGKASSSGTQYAGVDLTHLPSDLKDEDFAKILVQYLTKDAACGKFLTKVDSIPEGADKSKYVEGSAIDGSKTYYQVKESFTDADTALAVDGTVTFVRAEKKNNITVPVTYSVKVWYAATPKPYTFEYTFAEDYEDEELAGETVKVDIYFAKDSLVRYKDELPKLTYDFITGTLGYTPEGGVKDDAKSAELYTASVKKELQEKVDENRKVEKIHALWNHMFQNVKAPNWTNKTLQATIDAYIDEWKENVGAMYQQVETMYRQDQYLVNNGSTGIYLSNYATQAIYSGDYGLYMLATTYQTERNKAEKDGSGDYSLEKLMYVYAKNSSDNAAAANVKDEATLDVFLQAVAKENILQKLLIHYIADVEGLNPTEEAYQAYLQKEYQEYYDSAKQSYDADTSKDKGAFTPYEKDDYIELMGETPMREGFLWDTVMQALVSDEKFDNEFPQIFQK